MGTCSKPLVPESPSAVASCQEDSVSIISGYQCHHRDEDQKHLLKIDDWDPNNDQSIAHDSRCLISWLVLNLVLLFESYFFLGAMPVLSTTILLEDTHVRLNASAHTHLSNCCQLMSHSCRLKSHSGWPISFNILLLMVHVYWIKSYSDVHCWKSHVRRLNSHFSCLNPPKLSCLLLLKLSFLTISKTNTTKSITISRIPGQALPTTRSHLAWRRSWNSSSAPAASAVHGSGCERCCPKCPDLRPLAAHRRTWGRMGTADRPQQP